MATSLKDTAGSLKIRCAAEPDAQEHSQDQFSLDIKLPICTVSEPRTLLWGGFGSIPALHKDAISSHIEHLHADETETRLYPPVADTLPDDQLPFIPAQTVLNVSSGSNTIWIVIDNIVYDCTNFIFDHPGGSTVINSFVGKDCSWQFWRFHTREHMREFGRKLRIGRTEGVKNPFKEPARYVGLRRLGEVDKEWD